MCIVLFFSLNKHNCIVFNIYFDIFYYGIMDTGQCVLVLADSL